MISGTVWWVCQFGIASHISWHSLVGVPIWNSVAHFMAQFGIKSNHFWYSLVDVPNWNTVTSGTVSWLRHFSAIPSVTLLRTYSAITD